MILHGNYSATGTSTTIVFPQNKLFIAKPTVSISLFGGSALPDLTYNTTDNNGILYYDSVTITVDAADVGKTFSLVIVSNEK